jgi:N-acetylmuramoyl-L-alanine amidase
VQYQWHRLKPPDNRYFIDITNAVLRKGARKIPLDDYYVREVRIAQFQNEPVPVVRVVVDLNVPAKVTAFSNTTFINTLIVDVEHSEVDMDNEALQGFGATAFPRKGFIICIDPGHGGWDPGAVNSALCLYEKTVTLDICLRLARKLKAAGWNVVLTRRKDTDVSIFYPDAGSELGARVAVANGMKAQIFVSVHCNSASNTAAMGTSTHWCKDSDLTLAKIVHGPVIRSAGRPDRGLRKNRFYVLRNSSMPSVLVETAFISSATEAKLLASPHFREKVAQGIFHGVQRYAAAYLKPPKKRPKS